MESATYILKHTLIVPMPSFTSKIISVYFESPIVNRSRWRCKISDIPIHNISSTNFRELDDGRIVNTLEYLPYIRLVGNEPSRIVEASAWTVSSEMKHTWDYSSCSTIFGVFRHHLPNL